MVEYRLLSYQDAASRERAGILVNGRVLSTASLLVDLPEVEVGSVLGLLQRWSEVHPRLTEAAQSAEPNDGMPLESVNLLAPILYPGAVFCTGANYWDHLNEMMARMARMSGTAAPRVPKAKDPWFFLKTPRQTVIGTGADVRIPARSHKFDYEAEVGVVIGTPARNVSVAEALQYVAGYTCLNDLSARDLSTHEDRQGTRMHVDWVSHKCFDDGLPMGPWITPAAFVPDPMNLDIQLWVNGDLRQSSNSGNMIHSIAEQIATLSGRITLMPGDVIATGTPAGVGAGRGEQGEFLGAGDVVEIEVQHIGRLSNRLIRGV